MNQVTESSNPVENIVGIPGPSTKGVTNSSIRDENSTPIATNKRLKNTVGNKKTKTLDAKAKNLKDSSIPAGTRKVKKTIAAISIIRKKTKNLDAKAKNLKDSSIPAGTRKVKKTIAAISIITRERKKAMIIDSIKTLKTQNGASLEDICKHMGENYQVDMELWKPRVSKFLKNNVQNGALEKTNEAAEKERFKLMESVTNENVPQNLLSKDRMQSKADKRKAVDLPESRKLIKKADQSVTSDVETNSRNEVSKGSTMIENLEAIPGPTKDVISQTEARI